MAAPALVIDGWNGLNIGFERTLGVGMDDKTRRGPPVIALATGEDREKNVRYEASITLVLTTCSFRGGGETIFHHSISPFRVF